jgi:hypothetical protein
MTGDDQEKRLDELLQDVPPEKSKVLLQIIGKSVLSEIQQKIIPQTIAAIRKELGHSDVVLDAVDELASKTTDTREDVLLKALSLYEAAVEAKQRGQRLVVVGPEYQFIREIIGFDQLERESARHEKVAR